MPIFTGTDLAEVVAQINKDNPALPWPINETDFIFGKPEVIANPTDGRNTKIKITPKGISKYRGVLTLSYTRRDLTNLFRGQTVRFTRWLNDNASMTFAQAIGYVNQLYGINLQATKMSGAAWSFSNNAVPRTWTATADNLAYVGSFTVTWYRGLQQLGLDILTVTELDGAKWPGGNDFVADPDRQYRGDFLMSGVDWTEYALANGWTAGSSLAASTIIAELARVTGLAMTIGTYNADTAPFAIPNSTFTAVALPSAAYPEANKPGFAYAKIMQITSAQNPKLAGKIILYFNL